MNNLSKTFPQTKAFQSWQLVLMAVILLAAAATSGLYITTVQAQSHGAITGLTLSSDTPGALTVSWDPASPTPTDYRVDWAKSNEDYQSWKIDDGHVYLEDTATTVTIADLDHDTEYKIRMRARYYRGEHEGKSWGGPWAEATLQVKGNPQPEQAEEPPEPNQPPPAAKETKDKETSSARQAPLVTWTEIPHTGKEIDGKFYKHIEDTRFLMVWDTDTETGPRLPAYEVQFAQCNSTANAAITYEHTQPVNGSFKIRHRTASTTDPAWERTYPPTDNDRWQIYSGAECDANPKQIVSAIWNNQNVVYLRHQYSNILEAHTITDYAQPATTATNRAPQLDIPLKIDHRHLSSFAQGIGLGPDPAKPNILYILVGNRGPLQPYDIDTQQPDAVEPTIDPGISSITILIDFHFVSNQTPAVGYFTHNDQELHIYKRTFTKTTGSTTYTLGQVETVAVIPPASIGTTNAAQSLTGFDSIIFAASHQAANFFTWDASANDSQLDAAFPRSSILRLIRNCGNCGIRVSTYDGLVLYATSANGEILAIVSNSGGINQNAFTLPENAGAGHKLDNFFTVNTTYPPSTSTFTSTDTSTRHHECFELESQGSTQQVIRIKVAKPKPSHCNFNFESDPPPPIYGITARFTWAAPYPVDTKDIPITITITDVDEPPPAPTDITITPATTAFRISWTDVPDTEDRPAVLTYNVGYAKVADSSTNCSTTPGPWSTYIFPGTFSPGEINQGIGQIDITSAEPDNWYCARINADNTQGVLGIGLWGYSSPIRTFAEISITEAQDVTSPENATGSVATFTIPHPGQTIDVQLEGGVVALFRLQPGPGDTYSLVFITPPDYENPANAALDNIHRVTLRTTTTNAILPAIKDHPITVTVTNVNEPSTSSPAISGGLREGDTLTIDETLVTDPDGPNLTAWQYQWRRSQTPNGTYTRIAGENSKTFALTHSNIGKYIKVHLTYSDNNFSPPVPSQQVQSQPRGPVVGNDPPTISFSPTPFPENQDLDPDFSFSLNDPNPEDNTGFTATLSGPQESQFTITSDGTNTFKLDFKTPPDYEQGGPHSGNKIYNITITATSGTAPRTRSKVQDFVIQVSDVDEPPLAPTSITFSDTKQRSINVAWAAPNNTGRPPIEKYQLQYRSHSDDPWPQVETANIIDNITTTNHTVTPLDRDTQYDFRVRALNDEGTGPWSEPSPHSTNANQPPQITSGHTASIAENAPSNQLVTTVMTTDPDIADGGTWGFTTDGAHAAKFHITQASSLLTITVNDNLDYEQLPLTDKTLSFTLNVTDNQGGQDSALVTITVTDVDEPPARPAQPTVTVPAAPRTLTITWSPPTNTGPPITSYTLQYRKGTSGPFADVHTGPALSHTHSGLTANSRYDYQVLATNDEGSSPYSPVGHGTTPPNVSPTFGAVRSYENDLQEDIGNTPGSIQTLKPVNATDPDNGTITYTLEGPDRNSFTIDETTGAIQTKARVFDHESKATYSFQARASDNHRGETPLHDQVDITVNILDLNELPLTPTDVVAEHPTRFQYQIRWSPPENTGRPPIDHYTIEWTTDRNSPPTSKETATTSSTVAALLPDTVYSTRVTAHNADGDGQPSQWQDIRTLPNNPPVFAATSRTRILDENNAPQANVGSPIPVTDPDSDTIAYSIDGTNPGGFTIEPTTGQIKAGNQIYNHEQTPSYTITVTANDQQGGSTSQNVAITIRDVDEPPHKVQLPTASNQSLTSITFTWNEPTNTGPPVTGYEYQYRKGSAGWRPVQQTTATTITLPGLDQDSPYSFHVSAVNDEGTGPYSDPAGSRTNQNSPPAFPNATTTLTVKENSTSGTVGTITATDPDGETLTYSVDGADETDFNQDFSLNTATATITIKPTATIDHETKPSYSVNITARDPSGGPGNVALTIVVTNVNEPGLVTLTPTSPTAARTLTAALTDPDQDISGVTWTWAWAPISAGPFTTISSATNAAYTPLPADIGRYLKATATYADHFGAGQTAEKVSENPVRNNPPPVFPNPAVTFTVDENSTAGTVGTITATDPDGETITYSVGGADETDFNQDFSLNTSTATITIKPTATIDHETRPSYTVVVTATDSANVTTTVNLTINVNDLNEAGAVSLAPTTPTVAKPLTATVNDPDGTATGATWTWSWNTTRIGSFTTISGASGKTYTPATADAGRYLKASVSYTDLFGSGQSAEQVSDNAVAANPPPVFANNSVTLSVNENTTSGTVGTITATDPDGDAITHSVGGTDETAFKEDFSLDASNGLITVRSDATIDHETRPSYSVTITATDPYGGTDTVALTITVTNVDEHGTVTLSQPTPVVGEPLTATLDDLDGGVTSATWSWSWSATSTGSYTSISGANSPTYTPVQPDVGRYLKATVSYTDSLTSGRSASQTADNETSNNPPPEFANNSVTLSVNENTTSGTVGTITATDPDGDAITYSVDGTDETAFKEDFRLNASDGEITVKSDATIDHESRPSYSVRITATDPYGGTDQIDVTITVTNVDEHGMVTLSRTTPTVGKPLTANLTDPDGGITGTTWSWSSSVTSTGSFTTVSGANNATYTPVQPDVGRYLKLVVTYTDSSGSGKNAETTSTNAVVANPPPAFPNHSVTFTVKENSTSGTVGRVRANDPDNDPITYSIVGTEETDFNQDFRLNPSTGRITVRSDASINQDTKLMYSVTITATDPYGGTDTVAVTIYVTDMPVNVTPHPPINLQASPTDDHVTLTWQGSIDNFHVSGYRIQRYQGHRSGWQTVTPFQPAANQFPWDNPGITETYLDTNILPSTPYRYRVRSMNEQGISTHYAGINVETAVEPPGLRIFADHGKVTIGWDTPEDDTITGYRILRRIQWENQETPVGDTERGDTGWTDRQVSPNTAYAYRLQALRDGRPGARSRYLFTLTPRIATPTVVVSEPEGQDLAAGTETIGRIDVGGSVTGTIDSVDDRDWFAVEMEASETYHARLSYMTKDGLRSFTNGRVVLGCLMGADGTDSPDICLNKGRVNFEVEQAGTYYIVIQPRWYQPHLGHPEMPTEYELELDHDVDLPQDSSIAAPYGALRTSSEVEVGTWVSGQLHNGDLADNHRVQLQQGNWYRVPVFFNYGPETDGILANAGTVRIGTGQQNSRWSNTSPHLFRASQTGTHYLNVARETDISTIYTTQHTSYYQEATYKFLVEDLGTLTVEESTSSN